MTVKPLTGEIKSTIGGNKYQATEPSRRSGDRGAVKLDSEDSVNIYIQYIYSNCNAEQNARQTS